MQVRPSGARTAVHCIAFLWTVAFGGRSRDGTLLVGTSIGLPCAGHLADADDIGRRLYEQALAEDDEWSRPRARQR